MSGENNSTPPPYSSANEFEWQQHVGGTDPGCMNPTEAKEDQRCFARTVFAFQSYHLHAKEILHKRRKDFNGLSDEHKQLLGLDYNKTFNEIETAIDKNQEFLNSIGGVAETLFSSYWPDVDFEAEFSEWKKKETPTHLDIDKVFSTLRQFVRDWSQEGETERGVVYGPIKKTLQSCFPDITTREYVKVLVPGAGLSRLSLEIALLGFFSQGNEFSYHMLLAGHYILNHVEKAGMHSIHPFADTSVNAFSRADQCREILIPDISTYQMIDSLSIPEANPDGIPFGPFSMIAGDFVEVYSKPKEIGTWSVVATCFFIDTAHNIVEYLQTIFNALQPGGLWINLGPLLYHYADNLGEQSIELSLDEVCQVAKRIGFEFLEPVSIINATYAGNGASMKQQFYRCAYFCAKKGIPSSSSAATQQKTK